MLGYQQTKCRGLEVYAIRVMTRQGSGREFETCPDWEIFRTANGFHAYSLVSKTIHFKTIHCIKYCIRNKHSCCSIAL